MFLKDVSLVWLLLLIGLGSSGGLEDPRSGIPDEDVFRGSDQYDFAFVLPAGGLECYWHYSHYGQTFYLNFMVSKT